MSTKMFDAIVKATGGLAERLHLHAHAWYNGVTGYGTTRDKTTYGSPVSSEVLGIEQLEALYNHNDMAARMVDVLPDEVYREGFSILTEDPELDEILQDKCDQLCVAERFADGMRWGRAYGGGAVLIGADDGNDASKPLKIERAKDIGYLYDLDRRQLLPHTYYTDFGNPKLGQVETYLVWNQNGGAQILVHESRLFVFGGATTGRQERLLNSGWDLSILQRAHETLRQFDTGWKSVEILLTDAHQTVMKMSGLADIIAAPNGLAAMQRRAMLTDMYRSVLRSIVVDSDSNESVERQAVSFESIPQTLDKLMLRLAATAQVPVTILMGQSPAGMSATGESDFRWFYNRCESDRTRKQAPKIRRLAQLWFQTGAGREAIKGKKLDNLTVKWPSLWTEPPSVEATRRKTIAETDAIQIQSQVYTPDEIALVRGRVDGWCKDVQLSDKAVKAREAAVASDLASLTAVDGATATEGGIPITPSDVATVITVNEARSSLGLAPVSGAEGEMTLLEFKARNAQTIAEAAQAEAGTKPGEEPPNQPDARFDAKPYVVVVENKDGSRTRTEHKSKAAAKMAVAQYLQANGGKGKAVMAPKGSYQDTHDQMIPVPVQGGIVAGGGGGGGVGEQSRDELGRFDEDEET